MTDEHLDELIKKALITSIKRDWIDTPVNPEVDVIDTSRLDKKMAKLSENPTKYIKAVQRPWYMKAMRSVAAVIIIISILFGTAMLNAEARAWFRELIARWFGDHNEYTYNDPYNQSVDRNWNFGYIPEGFELIYEDKIEHECYYEFSSDTEDILRITISGGAGTLYNDNEHYEIRSVKIGNDIADAYVSFDHDFSNSLIWPSSEDDVVIIIDATLKIKEIIKIAERISS